MKRRRKIHDYELDDGDDIAKDGEVVRCRMDMMDAAQREVQEFYDTQTVVDHKLADLAACAGHRPGYLDQAVSSAAVRDAMRSRGLSIERILQDRAQAFADLERRSRNAWVDAKVPDDDDDEDDDDDDKKNEFEDALAAREAAYQATVTRQDWRLQSSRTGAIEAQAERWRGGR
jgi:hypothetical protein